VVSDCEQRRSYAAATTRRSGEADTLTTRSTQDTTGGAVRQSQKLAAPMASIPAKSPSTSFTV
jgi:hypothetical protein